MLVLASQPGVAQPAASSDVLGQLRALRAAGETTPAAVKQLRQVETGIPQSAPYALRRELMLTQLVVLEDDLDFSQQLALMQSLRDLAQAKDDTDTVSLMDINRIYASHSDDDIDKYLGQLNVVRSRITSNASPEVMEALERSYGNMYFDAGNFDTALRHQFEALNWASRLPMGKVRAQLFRLSTIAELYNAMDLPEQALEHVDHAFTLAINDMPVENRISLLGARAKALLHMGRLPEAEKDLAGAEALAKHDGSAFTSMRLGTLRADLLLSTSRPDKAIAAIDNIEAIASQHGNGYYTATSWMLRGQALMQLGQAEDGFALMQKAADYFESKGQMIDVLSGLDRQIRTLRDKQLLGRAIKLMDDRQQTWGRLFRNERGRAIAEVEARHTATDLEQRIVALSTQNQIQDQRLRAERLAKALAMVLALFALSLCVFLFYSIRRARMERDKLSDVVRYDALTGASSRYQFQRRQDPVQVDATPNASFTGLLLLDIDDFKAVNDQHGHAAGDAVLIAVVERIRHVLGGHDEIYRWGGEEFLVILNHREHPALQRDALRILSAIEHAPISWHGESIPISVSGGYVHHPLAPGWQAPLADGIRWADAALYLAKQAGRRRIEHVRLTEAGSVALKGSRPIDVAQLLDWQRQGHVEVHALQAGQAPKHASGPTMLPRDPQS